LVFDIVGDQQREEKRREEKRREEKTLTFLSYQMKSQTERDLVRIGTYWTWGKRVNERLHLDGCVLLYHFFFLCPHLTEASLIMALQMKHLLAKETKQR